MNDRVSYSYGVTVPGPEQFSSRRFDLSVETDVRPNETTEQAMARAHTFVLAEAARRMAEVVTPAPAGLRRATVQDELFDPNDSNHQKLASMVFDAEKVTSTKARWFVMHNKLKGAPVAEIGNIVRKNNAEFQSQKTGSGRR